MSRPWILQRGPLQWRLSLYYRFYRAQRQAWRHLYSDASLYFCPRIKMDLLVTDEAHSNIAFTGFYETFLSRRILNLAAKGGLLIDVGANYGYFSLLWAGLNSRNRSVAFEASPRNYPFLKQNIEKNGLAERVTSHPVAVGRESGLLRFALGPLEETGWGGFTVHEEEAKSIEVQVRTLDDLLPPDADVAVLKIDVEGADTWVLYGAERLLRERRIKHIFFECNRPRMLDLGIRETEAVEFLKKHGYEVFNPDSSGELLEARPALQ